jgi:hypothetical protein
VLRIQAVSSGYRKWRVAPLTLGLEWATSTLPTPQGEISVAWNATKGVIIKLEVKRPACTSGTVEVPVRAGSYSIGVKFLINGEQVQGNGTFSAAGGESFVLILEI